MARTLTMTFFILTLFSLPSQGQTRLPRDELQRREPVRHERRSAYGGPMISSPPATATGRPDGFTINYNNWQKSSQQRENGALRL